MINVKYGYPSESCEGTLLVKIGFIGCGGISRSHVARLSQLGQGEAEIKGLCDKNPENTRRLMKAVNKFRNITPEPLTEKSIYTDYNRMLNELDLEAIIVCTPHVLHYEHVMAGLKRGLHVFVEKPMALSISQAEEIRDTAEKEGLILAVGYQRHFQPEYFYAREGHKKRKNRFTSLCSSMVNSRLKKSNRSSRMVLEPGSLRRRSSHMLRNTSKRYCSMGHRNRAKKG